MTEPAGHDSRPSRLLKRVRAAWFRPLQSQIDAAVRDAAGARRETRAVHLAVASLQADRARSTGSLRDAEFQAFSQFGEDGAIQWLIARVPIADRSFVEFGVEDYGESNTRFLLEQDGWRGLILDGGSDHVDYVRREGLAWRLPIDARQAFVTAENIDALLAGQPADLGLLSVDVDGMDYWILSAIRAVRPRIVVCEYNSLWGPDAAVSVPYRPDFDRRRAHHSLLYFGASISALEHWGRTYGYRLVGSTRQGVNAFLVRDDVAGDLADLSGAEAWVETPVRQARDEKGELTYVTGQGAQRSLIAHLPLVDVTTGDSLAVGDLR
jgi:hypothetical protein